MKDENIVSMEMNEKALEKWKAAYKNCKKQRSIIKKDAYDAFIFDIKKRYNDNVRKELKMNRNNINIRTFISFFDYVCNKSNECLKQIESKKISFYRNKRKRAVEDLRLQSENMISDLNEMLSTKVSNGDASKILKQYNLSIKKKVSVSSKIENCILSYVFDVGASDIGINTDYFKIRIYMVVSLEASGVFSSITPTEDFSFKKYELSKIGDTKSEICEDKDIGSRSMYLVYERDIKADVAALGGFIVKARVYASPNDVPTGAVVGVAVQANLLTVDERSLSSVVITD